MLIVNLVQPCGMCEALKALKWQTTSTNSNCGLTEARAWSCYQDTAVKDDMTCKWLVMWQCLVPSWKIVRGLGGCIICLGGAGGKKDSPKKTLQLKSAKNFFTSNFEAGSVSSCCLDGFDANKPSLSLQKGNSWIRSKTNGRSNEENWHKKWKAKGLRKKIGRPGGPKSWKDADFTCWQIRWACSVPTGLGGLSRWSSWDDEEHCEEGDWMICRCVRILLQPTTTLQKSRSSMIFSPCCESRSTKVVENTHLSDLRRQICRICRMISFWFGCSCESPSHSRRFYFHLFLVWPWKDSSTCRRESTHVNDNSLLFGVSSKMIAWTRGWLVLLKAYISRW